MRERFVRKVKTYSNGVHTSKVGDRCTTAEHQHGAYDDIRGQTDSMVSAGSRLDPGICVPKEHEY